VTVGETRITGMLEGEDAISTANAMAALGATVERTGERAWRVVGVGVGGFASRGSRSISAIRARLPSRDGRCGGLPDHRHLRWRRPACGRGQCGAFSILWKRWVPAPGPEGGGRLPLTMQGAVDPMPIVYEPPVASAQIKSAVLLAGLAAPAPRW